MKDIGSFYQYKNIEKYVYISLYTIHIIILHFIIYINFFDIYCIRLNIFSI